jgi:hypothetical protein
MVSTALVCIASAHLPPAAKKLGLLAVGLGLLIGWLAGRLADHFDLTEAGRRARVGAIVLIVLAGQIGMALESWRLHRQDVGAARIDAGLLAAMNKLQSTAPAGDSRSEAARAEIQRSIADELDRQRQRLAENRSFGGYLVHRVSGLGAVGPRGAAAIWIGEALLGSLAAGWMFRRSQRLAPVDRTAKLS